MFLDHFPTERNCSEGMVKCCCGQLVVRKGQLREVGESPVGHRRVDVRSHVGWRIATLVKPAGFQIQGRSR
jgi:hypothetical protein